MLEKLYQILNELREAIEYAELSDMAHTKYYTSLLKKRKAINKAIKRLERIEKRYGKLWH